MADLTVSPPNVMDVEFLSQISGQSTDCEFSYSQLSALAAKQNLFAIETEGVVVGFIAQSVVLDEAELLQLTISSTHRRKGYAKKAIINWLAQLSEKNVAQVFLEVREQNTAAVSLYESVGFAQAGIRKGYYQVEIGSQNALVMSKNL